MWVPQEEFLRQDQILINDKKYDLREIQDNYGLHYIAVVKDIINPIEPFEIGYKHKLSITIPILYDLSIDSSDSRTNKLKIYIDEKTMLVIRGISVVSDDFRNGLSNSEMKTLLEDKNGYYLITAYEILEQE